MFVNSDFSDLLRLFNTNQVKYPTFARTRAYVHLLEMEPARLVSGEVTPEQGRAQQVVTTDATTI